MYKYLVLLFFSMIILAKVSAQSFYITGLVRDSATGIPLHLASIYINNTTIGTSTSTDGKFSLGPLNSGQYDVVVSYVGYQTMVSTVLISAANETLSFSLVTKEKNLREVLILTKNTRQKYLEFFRKQLLGFTRNAANCKILNLDDVQFSPGETSEEIFAWCDKELVIENPALGYTIHFNLIDFYFHQANGSTYFFGYTRFENSGKNGIVKNKHLRNRRNCYEGSSAHFFKSLAKGNLAQEGFEVLRIKSSVPTTSNNNQTSTIKIQHSPKIAYKSLEKDSLLIYDSVNTMDTTYKTYKLDVKEGWLINYRKVTALKNELNSLFFLSNQPLKGTGSGITVRNGEALIDQNGTLLNPRSIYLNGVWAFERLANMLPENYRLDE